jgi:serine/threonine-protein kinase
MSLVGKSVGNYQIKSKLGEGGMGAVYLGEHPLIGKRVAVKVLLEELAAKEDIVNRFFNEAKAVNDIGHQNIVDIVDFGKMKSDTGGDVVYFIMEFLDGESLSSRIRRTGLTFVETLHVMAQACSALAASHAKNIVHRDLKPENIYLCPRGGDKNFVKILDFGIAKLTDDGAQSHKTRTGVVIGTPAYMSPEQCEGKGHIDLRSDVYSIGVVMYELLTGRVPFPGEGFGEILVAHLTRQPQRPSELNANVPPELDAIVMHAIEKDRNRRFQTMDEFAQAIADPATHLAHYNALPGYAANAGTMMLDSAGNPMRPMTGAQPIIGASPPVAGATVVGPRVTTLSGSAGEVAGQPKSRSSMLAMVGVAALLVVGGGAFLAWRGKADPNAQNAIVKPTDKKPVESEDVIVKVESDPPGARVKRAGASDFEPGTTPLTMKVKRNSGTFDVQLVLTDYKGQTRTISTERDSTVDVLLEKVEKPAAVVPVVRKEPAQGDEVKPKRRKVKAAPEAESPGGDDMKLLPPSF